jgi:hypothetical protein
MEEDLADIDAMRKVLHASLKRLTAELEEKQEIITTIYLLEREFRMIVTQVSSFDPNFLRLSGVNEAGYPTDMIFPADQATFKLEVVSTGRSNRIGFVGD